MIIRFTPHFFVLLLTALIYWPGIQGGFVFDDFPNIVHNTKLVVKNGTFAEFYEAAFSVSSGPLGRPVAMISFALESWLWGMDPRAFKLTNIGIHLLNVGLIFLLIRRLLVLVDSSCSNQLSSKALYWVPVIIAALWAVAPINLTSVLYIVQRMTSLATLFVLLALLSYIRARTLALRGQDLRAVGYGLLGLALTLVGCFAKENAALVPVYCLLIELFFFRFQASDRIRWALLTCYGLFMLIMGVLLIRHVSPDGFWTTEFHGRTFSPYERLLTEARVLFYHVGQIILPRPSAFALYHDGFALSRNLLDPLTTLLSIGGWLCLIVLTIFWRSRAPLFGFGVGLFLASHLMESTVIGLEIAHEHRNYFGSLGILLSLYAGATLFRETLSALDWRPFIAVAALLLFTSSLTTFMRAQLWGDMVTHDLVMAEYHPESGRSQYAAGAQFHRLALLTEDASASEQAYQKAVHYYRKSFRAESAYIDGLIAKQLLDDVLGKALDLNEVAMVQSILNERPLSVSVASGLISWSECYVEKLCQRHAELVSQLMGEAAKNLRLGGLGRANLYAAMANLAVTQGSIEQAIIYSEKSYRLNRKNVQGLRNTIELLIAAGRLEEAKSMLQELQSSSFSSDQAYFRLASARLEEQSRQQNAD